MAGSGNKMGAGCLVLFGLPFLGAGLAIATWGTICWITYARSADWPTVPATIQAVEFTESTDSDGDTTYGVDATYTYEFEGRQYTGDRVTIMGGSSSDYGYHRENYRTLEDCRKTGRPFQAYVDPSNPEKAFLFREPEMFMYIMIPFGLVFAGAGCLVIGLGARSAIRKRKLETIRETQGDKDWLIREDWRECRVESSAGKQLLVAWLAGIGLPGFISIFVVAIAMSEGVPFFAKAVVGLFALIAVMAFLRAVMLTVRQVVHGSPTLYLSEVPIVPGRRVAAAVRTAKPIRPDKWVLRLCCYGPTSGENESQETRERRHDLKEQFRQLPGEVPSFTSSTIHGICIYREQFGPEGEPSEGREGETLLPVVIAVPTSAPPTSLESDFPITWVLEVKAKAFPASFAAGFELPVFPADEEEIVTPTGGRF